VRGHSLGLHDLIPDISQKRGLELLGRAFVGHSEDFVPCRRGLAPATRPAEID
jgi:hypothetical protein